MKHRLLKSIGAEVPENGESLPGEDVKHPLRAARYAAAAGDLGDGTWAASLQKAGQCECETERNCAPDLQWQLRSHSLWHEPEIVAQASFTRAYQVILSQTLRCPRGDLAWLPFAA